VCDWNTASPSTTLTFADGTTENGGTSLSQSAGNFDVQLGGDQGGGHGDWAGVQDANIVNDVASTSPTVCSTSFWLDIAGWGPFPPMQPQGTSGEVGHYQLTFSNAV